MKKHNCKGTYLIGSFIFIAIVWVACRQNSFHSSIIDTHEHVELISKADLLLKADEANSIKKTILLASPIETLTLNGHKSFTKYRENTEEIFRIAEKYPNRFLPFCTVNPLDSDALEYLQSCFKRGGKGLKLYNGHSYYYAIFGIPLDSPRMEPIYAFAERNKIPVLYHINITNYGKELERVLDAHPDMVVSVPHFMVSSIELDKVAALLDKYPNLYTDVSFGSPEFMAAGFRRISKDPGKYRNFINRFKDRIL
ncbi:MAG: amidohydrolase family protein, partial [Patescibacteria group bacterium]